MARRRRPSADKPQIAIAPMIDCVFLLLIYFMVSATLEKQEADLSFELPGTVETSEPVDLPDEQVILIRGDGQVLVNDYALDSPDAPRFTELATTLNRFRQAAEANDSEATVTIAPEDPALHQSVVKVMDACSVAGIERIHFSLAGGT